MARECLPRNEMGQMTGDIPRQVGNMVEEFAEKLCKEFPTVDFFDLSNMAMRHLSFGISMVMLHEATIRQGTRKEEE